MRLSAAANCQLHLPGTGCNTVVHTVSAAYDLSSIPAAEHVLIGTHVAEYISQHKAHVS